MSNPRLPSQTHTHDAPAEIRDFDAAVDANTEVDLNKDHREDTTTNPHNTTKAQVGLGFVPNVKQSLNESAPPINTNDSSQGYTVGSRWIDTTNNLEYVCTDATAGSAVWISSPRAVGNPYEAMVENATATQVVPNPRMIIGRLTGGPQSVTSMTGQDVAVVGAAASAGWTNAGNQTAMLANRQTGGSNNISASNVWKASNENSGTQYSGGVNFTAYSSNAFGGTANDLQTGTMSGNISSYNHNLGTQASRFACYGGGPVSGLQGTALGHRGSANLPPVTGASSTILGFMREGVPNNTAVVGGPYCALVSGGAEGGGGLPSVPVSEIPGTSTPCRASLCSCALITGSQAGAVATRVNNVLPSVPFNQTATFCMSINLTPTANDQVHSRFVEWEAQTILSDVDTKTDVAPIVPSDDYASWRAAFETVQPKAYRLIEQSDLENELRGFDADELQAAFPRTVLETYVDKRRVRRNNTDTAWIDDKGDEVDAAFVNPSTQIYAALAPQTYKALDTTSLVQTFLVTAQRQTAKLDGLATLLAQ